MLLECKIKFWFYNFQLYIVVSILHVKFSCLCDDIDLVLPCGTMTGTEWQYNVRNTQI